MRAIAQTALKRKTGARGLRGVLETAMLDIMFDIPSKPNVKEVLIDDKVITENQAPKITFKSEDEIKAQAASISSKEGTGDPAESA